MGENILKRQIPVSKNNKYSLTITSMGHSGEGVGRYEDFTVFVPLALIGEKVEVVITEVKKNYARGKVVAVNTASPDRVTPPCHIYEQCGGCQLQHLSYPAQLEIKRRQVIDALERIGKQADITVRPTIGMDDPWHYRNKMQFPIGMQRGRIVIGCYEQASHTIVDTRECLIQDVRNNAIANTVRNVAAQLDIAPYNEQTGQGVLRHVIGRVGRSSGELMIVLVTAVKDLPSRNRFIRELTDRLPNLVSVVQNINSRHTNVILGEKTFRLWGKPVIIDSLGEFSFDISARSFFQVNSRQAEVLYNTALHYAGLTGSETVIDAYCGTGTITLFLARQAQKVYGLEVLEQAVADARKNAAKNNVHNVEFIAGDVNVLMPQLSNQGVKPDVIVVDPPRAGCAKTTLETFAAMQPQRIVYVSCNPSSLARDVDILAQLGYKLQEVQPIDMFCQTSHVECVALIIRIK